MKRILGLLRLGAIIGIVSLLAPHGRAEIALTTLVTFDRTNGCIPQTGLVLGKDGNLYGTLSYGGWYDAGIVFRMAPDGKCVILVTFGDGNGAHPDCLIQGKDGNFYGTTLQGGPDGSGSIFKMAPDGTITTLATFGYDNGYGPWGLVQGRDGNLYGKMSQFRGQSTFEVTLGGKLIMPATNGMPADSGGLLKAKDGNFYSTTFSGRGDSSNGFGLGTVFRIGPDGARTNLIVFNGTNGANPLLDLMQGRDGNIYGTTRGGAFGQGTVFRVNLAKTSSPVPTNINVPILIHPPANKINLLMSALGNNGTVTTETNVILDSNNVNPYLDEFIFLPGGFRRMAATISATNETFRLALRYIGEVHGGHRPPKLPKGVTIADVSNVNYMISVWSMTIPPRPINFYGKVVDENDQPVAGAIAHFIWDGGVTNNDPRPFTDTGKISADVTTDSAGLFSLTNAMGTELDVSVGKAGYYISRRNRGAQYFKYSKMNLDSFYGIGDYFKPVSNNPVIYYLRKKGIGESLIGVKQNYRVARDGTPLEIDLTTGKASPGGSGDFVVQCWTDDQGKPSGAKYDWRCLITVPGGGIVPTDEEFALQAPENGYALTNEIAMPADRTNWTSQVDLKFFYRLADGRYGMMTFSMIAGGQHFCMMDSVLNPSGSRNLEPQ
jgi:uncharacterized repeat protein (TIGR03803 family)